MNGINTDHKPTQTQRNEEVILWDNTDEKTQDLFFQRLWNNFIQPDDSIQENQGLDSNLTSKGTEE